MRVFFIFLSLILSVISVQAAEIFSIPYENINEESKISVVDNIWNDKVDKKNTKDYLIKISSDVDNKSEYYFSDGTYAFATNCSYEFINKGDFIGYSDVDLKFYRLSFVDNKFLKQELTKDDVQLLFPDYHVVTISQFSSNTNSLRLNKDAKFYKLILLNDTQRTFENYSFSSENAKFSKSDLLGVINIKHSGMIHFSNPSEFAKDIPWFILMIK